MGRLRSTYSEETSLQFLFFCRMVEQCWLQLEAIRPGNMMEGEKVKAVLISGLKRKEKETKCGGNKGWNKRKNYRQFSIEFN